MVESVRVSYRDWLHGLVPCPGCGPPFDAEKDLESYSYGLSPQPTGARVTHRRCGSSCWIEFEG